MKRIGPFVGVVALTLAGSATAVARVAADDPPPPPAVTETVVQTVTVDRKLQGRGVWFWHARAKANYRTLVSTRRGLRRELLRRWDYPHLIAVAAHTFSVDRATLERKARCESVNFTDFYNERSHASNVFQFLPSTWATTPYARFDIFDPFAAVLAGAWMHRVGRGGEWSCR